jgi:hypothetical protein
MHAYELAEAKAASAIQALQSTQRAHVFGLRLEAADLRTRSTPYFHDALAQLILAASQVQRIGGSPHIALRRGVAVAPRVLLNVRIDGRELEFISVVDLDGEARAMCCETGSEGRIPLIRRWQLGNFESAGVILAHRLAVTEFLTEIRPSLALGSMASEAATARMPGSDHAFVDGSPALSRQRNAAQRRPLAAPYAVNTVHAVLRRGE